jgi:predicted nucleic acid-binding protein
MRAAMRTPKIYLETTIFNYFYDSDRDAHIDTVALFKEIQAGKYEAYTSTYVTDELIQANEPKRGKMLALITEYNISVIPASDEARVLADLYVKEGIIPLRYRYDGLHIACATVNDLEYIFSLNFNHINKLKTKTMTANVNIRQGYKPLTIAVPSEVVEYVDHE